MKDIELRIAELLYTHNCDQNNPISLQQIKNVVTQIGSIGIELSDESNAQKTPKKIFFISFIILATCIALVSIAGVLEFSSEF